MVYIQQTDQNYIRVDGCVNRDSIKMNMAMILKHIIKPNNN